jgi:hypothetical protein
MEECEGDIGMMIDSRVGRDCSTTTIGPTGVQYLNDSPNDDEDEPEGEVLTIGMVLGVMISCSHRVCFCLVDC